MTSETDKETAARYRQRAEDLRVRARDRNNAEISDALLHVAEVYEQMAESLQR